MRKSAYFLLILCLVFATLTCSKKINQSGLKPPKVAMIPTAADTSRSERGIDAVPERDAIRIEWFPGSDERVIQYEIYRRTEAVGAKFVKITAIAEPDSFYEDVVPLVGVRYFYTVLAVNDEDLRSESGDTLNYLLLQKAVNLQPTGIQSNTKPVFTWSDPNQAHEYVIRLLENASNRVIWISVVQADYGNQVQSVKFNSDQKAAYPALISGFEYRWRVDVRGNAGGSESKWATLRIQ